MLGGWLGLIILRVVSNLNDPMITEEAMHRLHV